MIRNYSPVSAPCELVIHHPDSLGFLFEEVHCGSRSHQTGLRRESEPLGGPKAPWPGRAEH